MRLALAIAYIILVTALSIVMIFFTHLVTNLLLNPPGTSEEMKKVIHHYINQVQPNPITILLTVVYTLAVVAIALAVIEAIQIATTCRDS